MNTPVKKSKLLDALAKLEFCLESPVVPGEMDDWTSMVQESFAEVEPLLKETVEKEHPKKLKQISQDDPGLHRRVTQLKEQDQESMSQVKQIRTQLDQIANKAEIIEPDEARLEDRLQEFIDKALEFILHVRKQEVAIDTWLLEALERDRGVVD